MSYIVPSDFETGKYKTAFTQFTITDLQACIDRYENRLLTELLGKDLLVLYLAGIIALDPIYTFIQGEFIEELNGEVVSSEGIKDMLMGFIWCEYQREINTTQTVFGGVKGKGENSTESTFNATMYHPKYLEALNSFTSIQEYIQFNSTIYPTFKGSLKRPTLPF